MPRPCIHASRFPKPLRDPCASARDKIDCPQIDADECRFTILTVSTVSTIISIRAIRAIRAAEPTQLQTANSKPQTPGGRSRSPINHQLSTNPVPFPIFHIPRFRFAASLPSFRASLPPGQVSRFALLLLVLSALSVQAQLDPETSKLLGAGYAAMINFAENPDIATAHYYIDRDGGDNPSLSVTRFGGEHVFERKDRRWNPFVGVNLPYLKFGTSFDDGLGGYVDTEWTALGAILLTGVKISATTNLTISPAIAWGYIRLENDTDYSGSASTNAPGLLDGILFNWTSDAWLVGASLGADYRHPLGQNTMDLHAGITHNLIETFQTPSGNVEFSSYATTLSLNGEFTHPTSLAVARCPVAVIGMLGGTTFIGPYRDELGFDTFIDAGLAFEADIDRFDVIIRKLRLGLKGIYGEEVVGWSAILSWKF